MAADPDKFASYLEDVLIGGPEKRAITLSEYDETWPRRFEQEQARIAEALGSRARRIAHIGSTAVPGLAAKPIIDVLVSVGDVDAEDTYAPALRQAGYVQRVREPGHRMFRTEEHDVHVHVWTAQSDEERRQILFRDWLRQSPSDREIYARTKRELARREWDDMNYYAEAKGEVIADIMKRAESWAADSEWHL